MRWRAGRGRGHGCTGTRPWPELSRRCSARGLRSLRRAQRAIALYRPWPTRPTWARRWSSRDRSCPILPWH
eukprot:5327184-Alexandrium_andersonii.AAC.1